MRKARLLVWSVVAVLACVVALTSIGKLHTSGLTRLHHFLLSASRNQMLGRRRRRYPSLDAFANLAAPTEAKRPAGTTLHPLHCKTKAHDEVAPPRVLVEHEGPRGIRPIITGPAWPLRITGLICKGLPVITVCNPALWEYSGDNLDV